MHTRCLPICWKLHRPVGVVVGDSVARTARWAVVLGDCGSYGKAQRGSGRAAESLCPWFCAHARHFRASARPCRAPTMNRYKITKQLGDGTYGSVLKAVNRSTGEVVRLLWPPPWCLLGVP